jgi:hypothetical protein
MIAYRTSLTAMLVVGALCAGCAGHRTKDAGYTKQEARAGADRNVREDGPAAEISRARTLIEQAEKSGGQQYAATELQSARTKLQLADNVRDTRKGNKKDRGVTARQQAEEAAADAELAVALAARGEAEKSAGEVAAGTSALRRESIRGETSEAPLQVPVRPEGVDQ